MLAAYRRGELRAGYRRGVLSKFREEYILDAVEAEMDADYIDRAAQIKASFSPLFSLSGAQAIMDRCMYQPYRARALREYDRSLKEQEGLTKEALEDLYTACEEADIFDKICPMPEDTRWWKGRQTLDDPLKPPEDPMTQMFGT